MSRATLAVVCCLLVATVSADQISIPHPPQANTQAKAAEMKANLNAIVEESNKQDARITALESGPAEPSWTVSLSGWTGAFRESCCGSEERLPNVGAHQANKLCREEFGGSYLAASVSQFSKAASAGEAIDFPSDRCPVFVKSYSTSAWWQYASTTGNLNYPIEECESASAIMCGASSGALPSSLFVFSGWVGDYTSNQMSSLGANQANTVCREQFGEDYQAASLDSFATSVSYGIDIAMPTENCPVFVKSYTSSSWYQRTSKTGNVNISSGDGCAALSVMCGYWPD